MKKNAKALKKIYSKVAILLIVVLCCSLVYKVLSDGFKIDNLSIANIKISGLYLKLDKKLILEIRQIDIAKKADSAKNANKSPDSAPKISDITQTIHYAIALSSFFQKLDLARINYDGERYFVRFDGDSFRVNVPYILADFALNNDGGDILLNIKVLKVKQQDLIIKGRILYLQRGGIFAFDLDSYINNRVDNVISFQGETNLKYLNIALDSAKLSSIEILAPYIKMADLDVYEWMYERSKYSAVTINRAYLYAKNLDLKNIDRVINDNLYADGILENVKLNFDDNLAHITAQKVAVRFKNGKLSFALKDGIYGAESKFAESSVDSAKNATDSANLVILSEAKNLTNSAKNLKDSANQRRDSAKNAPTSPTKISNAIVEISDFFAPQTLLQINLNLNKTLLDKNILEILENYEVPLPLRQISGKNSGELILDILLPSGDLEVKARAKGEIKIANSTFEIAKAKISIDSAKISLDGDKIELDSANVKFGEILQSDLKMRMDADKKTAIFSATPRKLQLKSGEDDILNLNKVALTANMDFNEGTFIQIAPLGVTIDFIDEIAISANLSNLLPYAPLLTKLDFKNGDLSLKIPQDSAPISLNATLNNLNYPIYHANKTRLTSLKIEGKISSDEIFLSDSANKIALKFALEGKDIDLNISDKIINVNEILESKIPLFAEIFAESSVDSAKNAKDLANQRHDSANKNQKNPLNILLEGQNLNIALFDFQIPFDEAMLKTTKSGFIANGRNKNGIANIILSDDRLQVEANNFSANFINGVFGKDMVSGGTFGVFGIYQKNRFVGDISAYDTTIKEMATLQNILTFIDTIPSLLVFKLPGFSASGYEIDEANVRVGVDSEYLALENIAIQGSSVDISGNGVVDLKTQDLNIRLELSTIKSLSSILNKIPIIGFLLLGEDGKISTDLTIKGTLENPKTEISLLEDTAKAPINILKRVFSPFQILIDELKKENKRRRGAR
ncbi:YhdP family protein [Helicobacter sp. 23-1044]